MERGAELLQRHERSRRSCPAAGDSVRGDTRMEKGAVSLHIYERWWIDRIEVGLADRPSLPAQMG